MTSQSRAWFVAGSIAIVACHHHAPADEVVQPPPTNNTRRVDNAPVDPAIAALFRDTLPTTPFSAEGRTFDVRNAAERQALQRAVARERALWNASKPRDYRFLTRSECFCPGPMRWLLLEVRHDQPVRIWDAAGRRVETTANDLNIDALFDNIARARDPLAQVQVAFDEHWHYPRYLRTSMIYPDGWSIVLIRGLHPL